MSFIINPGGLILLTFTVDNATVQSITAGSPITLQQPSGRPFGIVGASLLYTNATIQYKSAVGAAYAYLIVGGSVMGLYRDPGASLDISPGFAISYQVNYDESGPLFCAPFRDDDILIDFSDSYAQGDGEFIIKVAGFYF
jgi:hypothetical protein